MSAARRGGVPGRAPEDAGSVAEFRARAWAEFHAVTGDGVSRAFSLRTIGAGLVAGVGLMGVASIMSGLAVGWLVVAVAFPLAGWLLVRQFRAGSTGYTRQRELVRLSEEFDARARDGRIPLAPVGWAGEIPPPITMSRVP